MRSRRRLEPWELRAEEQADAAYLEAAYREPDRCGSVSPEDCFSVCNLEPSHAGDCTDGYGNHWRLDPEETFSALVDSCADVEPIVESPMMTRDGKRIWRPTGNGSPPLDYSFDPEDLIPSEEESDGWWELVP